MLWNISFPRYRGTGNPDKRTGSAPPSTTGILIDIIYAVGISVVLFQRGPMTNDRKSGHAMKKKIEDVRTLLNRIGGIILLIGLSGAILIYHTAGNSSVGVLGYEEAGGSVYPIMPEDSKVYLRNMEIYGGKAEVLADELRRGFDGLWHGKPLAFTVAAISVLASVALFYFANCLLYDPESDADDERGGDGTG